MKSFVLLVPLLLGSVLVSAQTPTLVQHVSCPNSQGLGSGVGGPVNNTEVYTCPLPEPSQSGNAVIVGLFAGASSSPKWAVSDDRSNAYTLAGSTTDSQGNLIAVYYALNVAKGTRSITVQNTGSPVTGYISVSASEYYNVAQASALDAQSCHAGSSSTSIAAGTITPASSGDLLWQWAADENSTGVSSISAGSQSNITWQLNGTDIGDGDATQAGVYTSTATVNPTFSSGSAQPWDSCVVALKAASAGTAPTQAFRVVHMLHEQESSSGPAQFTFEMPTSGNLIVLSFTSGANVINSLSSSPANNWTLTGPTFTDNVQVATQIYYAANATPSNTMMITAKQSGTMTGTTFMMYDITGASTAPFDVDSGGQSGQQKSTSTSLTTCSNCLTPSNANELLIGNDVNAWCTAMSMTSPAGTLFDDATFTGNSVNGPQSVDQNNGNFHDYESSTSPVTVTWNYVCGSDAIGAWAGRVAAFKGTSTKQPAPPTGLTGTVVSQ